MPNRPSVAPLAGPRTPRRPSTAGSSVTTGVDLRAAAEPRGFRVPTGTGWSTSGLSLRFVLPAVAETDFLLRVRGRRVIVSGHRRAPEFLANDAWAAALPYGRFERTVELTDDLDANALTARFHHGVLDVTVPYAAAMTATAARPPAARAPVGTAPQERALGVPGVVDPRVRRVRVARGTAGA